jgi:uncharacterized protein
MTSVRLAVRLTPRSGRSYIHGWEKDREGRFRLKVGVTAPPIEGAANSELQRLLAKIFECPRSAVRIVGGAHNRLKLLEIDGLDEDILFSTFGRPSS